MGEDPEETINFKPPSWLKKVKPLDETNGKDSADDEDEEVEATGRSWRDLDDADRGDRHFQIWAEENGWEPGDPDPLPDEEEPIRRNPEPNMLNLVNLKPIFALIVAMYASFFMVFWGDTPLFWFSLSAVLFVTAVWKLYKPLRDAARGEGVGDE